MIYNRSKAHWENEKQFRTSVLEGSVRLKMETRPRTHSMSGPVYGPCNPICDVDCTRNCQKMPES